MYATTPVLLVNLICTLSPIVTQSGKTCSERDKSVRDTLKSESSVNHKNHNLNIKYNYINLKIKMQ